MIRRMYDVEVYVQNGLVELRQGHDGGQFSTIILCREQAPIIAQWLQRAAAEAKARQAGGA